jgi:hypothetical protein
MLYEIFVYDQISYLHFFQMLHLRHRVVVDDHHLDVVVHQLLVRPFPVYLIYMANYLVLQCAVGNHQHHQHHLVLQCAVCQDVQQNLDEQNLDVNQPFQNVVVLLENLVVFVADVEPRHQLKMDCYLDVADVERRCQLKMDCYLDVLQVLLELSVMLELLACSLNHHRQLHLLDLVLQILQLLLYLQLLWLVRV